MTPFQYERATDTAAALRLIGPGAKYLAGGTNLVDLMRETVERPAALVDVSGLSTTIEERPDGGLVIGAGVKNTAVASHRGGARPLSHAGPGHPRRRFGADPQHGQRRRQHPAAHALHLLLRRRRALQQA